MVEAMDSFIATEKYQPYSDNNKNEPVAKSKLPVLKYNHILMSLLGICSDRLTESTNELSKQRPTYY